MNCTPQASAAPASPPAAGLARRPFAKSSQRGAALGWLIGVLILLALAAGVWWWHQHRIEAAGAAGAASGAKPGPGGPGGFGGGSGGSRGRFGGPDRVQPVSVAQVRRQDMHVVSTNIGTINAANTAVVHTQVSGTLQAIKFTEGQQVKAGDVLALIDPRAFQATLSQAEGALARDKAQLDNARVDLSRYQDLMKRDAIAKQILDTQAALVRQLEGTVKVDQAAVDSARLQLSYTRVAAPIGGRVGLKQADLGNIVNPGDANGLVSITQTRPIALVFAVPSAQLPQVQAKLRARQPLEVEAWDRGGTTRLALGQIATADNAIDTTTDTIKLKALFPNEDDALFPNQSVTVKLRLDTLPRVLAVPQAAVLRGAQGFYVYGVNADSSVATRLVKTGAVDGDWVQVDGQVKEGDTIVIDGVDRLRDGAKVEVIAADPTQRAGASAPANGGRHHRGGADAAASGASAPDDAASGAERSRLPPEAAETLRAMPAEQRRAEIEKLRAMSPEERHAEVEKLRQQHGAASAPPQ